MKNIYFHNANYFDNLSIVLSQHNHYTATKMHDYIMNWDNYCWMNYEMLNTMTNYREVSLRFSRHPRRRSRSSWPCPSASSSWPLGLLRLKETQKKLNLFFGQLEKIGLKNVSDRVNIKSLKGSEANSFLNWITLEFIKTLRYFTSVYILKRSFKIQIHDSNKSLGLITRGSTSSWVLHSVQTKFRFQESI